jgi:hypothetical protein
MSDLATPTLQEAVTDAAQAAVATPAEVASSAEVPAAVPPPAVAVEVPSPAEAMQEPTQVVGAVKEAAPSVEPAADNEDILAWFWATRARGESRPGAM